MSRYRLLAIDIDGTLVNSRDEITPAIDAALREAAAAGMHVVLATGRRYSRALPLVAPLRIEVPLITASGALIKNPLDHATLFQAAFDPPLLGEVLGLVHRCGFDPVVCADTFADGFDFYMGRSEVGSPELAEYLRLNPTDGRLWPELLHTPPEGVFAGFTMGTHQQMLEVEAELHRQLPDRLATHVLRSPRYVGFLCEIAPAGVTKWSAVQRLAASWNIDRSEICAVGDDVNDIPMIRGAGLGVAMGNALPAVKAAADRIAPTHDEDGLARVIQWLLE
jgi:5-amino-6-(5-phospho-D-ribitylamino)uracil phosphatase